LFLLLGRAWQNDRVGVLACPAVQLCSSSSEQQQAAAKAETDPSDEEQASFVHPFVFFSIVLYICLLFYLQFASRLFTFSLARHELSF